MPILPRGILEPPRIGPVRVPMDILPLLVFFAGGFFLGLPAGWLVFLLVVSGGFMAFIRKKGNGFLRGWILFRFSPKNRLWQRPGGRGVIGNVRNV
jgi:hypothetical protein